MGPSLTWIDEPDHRRRALHELNRRVCKSLAAAGIEIPCSKLDVSLKGHQGAAASPFDLRPDGGQRSL